MTLSPRMLRIMLVNGSLYGGGAERVIVTLARHLRELGHLVTVAAVHEGGELLGELRTEGFSVLTASAGKRRSIASLKESIRNGGIDVVHSHDLRSLIDVGICRLLTRKFAHVHTFHFGNYPFVSFKALLMEGIAARVPDQLVAVGNVQRLSVVGALKLSPSSIRTIWNGVDYSGSPAIAMAPSAARALRIGSLSTFGIQKGLPTLLQAAKVLKERGVRFQLVLVGDGPLRGELERMTLEFGLVDCVEFTGWRPEGAKALLPTFDIFVQSSHWEAMSIVILEAMAAERPIVATSVGENAAVLVDGVSAILVPPKDASALAAGLEKAITDSLLRARIAAAARQTYLSQFTGKGMAASYLDAYRQCMLKAPRVSLL